jgi:hypothetical protein
MKIKMMFAALAASCVLTQPAYAQDECASKVAAEADRGGESTSRQDWVEASGGDDTGAEPEVFQLKDPVYVQVTGLKEFLDENECRKAKNLPLRKLYCSLTARR